MGIVKVIRPDGKVEESYRVDVTPSGLLIRIIDDRNYQIFIHRLAWVGIVEEVQKLFDQEKKQAEEWLAEHTDEENL